MEEFPPPHMLFHEPMDDREMIRVWTDYTTKHRDNLDIFEIDAAAICSVEEFGRLFEIWVTSKSVKRIKLLLVWHAHFLSLACQQSLRRWLETKSYRSRVWFHVEYINNIQSAIQSRCILKHIQSEPVRVRPTIIGEGGTVIQLWKQLKMDKDMLDVTKCNPIC